MSKLNNFLNEVSEISNKDRLVIMGCTAALTGIGYVLNHQLFKSRIKNIDLSIENDNLKLENEALKIQKRELEDELEKLQPEED